MNDSSKPRTPRRSPSSQSIPMATTPVVARGTQQTKLRADGKSVISSFRGKLDDRVLEAAGTSAVGHLNGSELFWIMDFLQVPCFEGSPHAAIARQFEAFQKAGGRHALAAIPESMERYRILRSSIASLGLRYRVEIHHATNSEELAKLLVEQLKR